MTEEEYRKQFSARFASAIKKNNLVRTRRQGVQSQIAEYVGISPVAVNRWINGEAMPSMVNVHALANFLGVTPEWLVFGVDVHSEQKGIRKEGYPLVAQIDTQSAADLLEKLNNENIERLLPRNRDTLNEGMFFFKVSENYQKLPFERDDLLLVTQHNKLIDGKYVLVDIQGKLELARYCELNHIEISIKEYVLQTENGIYSTLKKDKDSSILGVVLESERHRKM